MLACGAFRGHSGRRGPSKTFLDLSPNLLTSSNLQGQNLSPLPAYFQEVGKQTKNHLLPSLPSLPPILMKLGLCHCAWTSQVLEGHAATPAAETL